ncbi:MAG: NAD-dependent epimerase/dehydratase family protein [Azoarcus sp. PHD]|nr:MAG: NAD-dependent epimerase/dehydratase family protein [Azoarcus sp. PHD]
MNTYFLTGASGAVGSAIVPLLHANENVKLRILLRAESDQHLAERFEKLCAFWGIAADAETRRRIAPLRGDAAEPNFGMPPDDYAKVVSDTTHIVHCAASVRMNLSLEEARHSAVGSMQAILTLARKLAENGTLRKIDLVSTVGIAGKRSGALPETWIDEPREFHNTYEQSKSEAEALARKALEEEKLPITIHRPSMVIGDSRDGKIIHFQIFYFICDFLSGRRTFGLYPDFGDVRLDTIPVNTVASTIVSSSTDPETVGSIFHLCSGPEKSIRLVDLRLLVRDAFHRHGLNVPFALKLPIGLFMGALNLAGRFMQPEQRRALATLPIYMDYLADQQGFDNRKYSAWLESRKEAIPDAKDYLPRVLARFLEQKHPLGPN